MELMPLQQQASEQGAVMGRIDNLYSLE